MSAKWREKKCKRQQWTGCLPMPDGTTRKYSASGKCGLLWILIQWEVEKLLMEHGYDPQ